MSWKQTLLIAILAILLTGAVNTFLTGLPFGLLFKAPWLLIATLVLDRKGGIAHILWLFGIPFLIAYMQYVGASSEAGISYEISSVQYFNQPTMIMLHIYNLLLYFGIYAIGRILRTKRGQVEKDVTA